MATVAYSKPNITTVKESVKKQISPEIAAKFGAWPDLMVHRFIVARKGDLNKAAEMLTKHLQWREEYKADVVLDEDFPGIADDYKSGFCGFDFKSNPVYVEFPGKANPSKILDTYSTDFLLRWHVCIMETGRKIYSMKQAAGVFVIIDASGLSMGHASKAAISYFKMQSAVDEANYPEHLAYCFIVNASMIFTTIWKMVSVFVDPITREKVKVLGGDYQETLKQYMDTSLLPPNLGGSKDMPTASWGKRDEKWKTCNPATATL
eukprot:TRINITY_DN95262_c0_g1_i1.p1 TRINITY_DN95262_c0_g1~~TRINITY_DN95262_c0_g1_i1.p1  ORF type:complete len:263 (+),score=46.84 TRINITY_DN95262_c0_g1_i1:52-840(+)